MSQQKLPDFINLTLANPVYCNSCGTYHEPANIVPTTLDFPNDKRCKQCDKKAELAEKQALFNALQQPVTLKTVYVRSRQDFYRLKYFYYSEKSQRIKFQITRQEFRDILNKHSDALTFIELAEMAANGGCWIEELQRTYYASTR